MSNDNNDNNEDNSDLTEIQKLLNKSDFDQYQQEDVNVSNYNNFQDKNKNQEHFGKYPEDPVREMGAYMNLSTCSDNISFGKTEENRLVIKEKIVEGNIDHDSFYENGLLTGDSHLIGLENPKAYCFLNSVLQLLFNCSDFRAKMIDYVLNIPATENDSFKEFAIGVGGLLYAMEHNNGKKLTESLKHIQESFDNSFNGDDIHKCFLEILSKINVAVRNPITEESSEQPINKADKYFKQQRNKNFGFVFDEFTGQMAYTIKCDYCDQVISETYQLFKSVPLQVSSSDSKISLQETISNSLGFSSIVIEEEYCCENPSRRMNSEITHTPKYLFLYLVRGAYNWGSSKNDTFVTFDKEIQIPTTDGCVPYKLNSVIDHVGGSSSGHYYVKSFSNCNWWLKNDFQVQQISWEQVQSKHAIGFLFEKALNGFSFQQNLIYTVIHIFYLCTDFKKKLIDFNKNSQNKNEFLKTLEKIFGYIMNNDEESIYKSLTKFEKYIGDCKMENIHEFYLNMLNSVNIYTTNYVPRKLTESFNDVENNQCPFDDFMGKIYRQIICQSCKCLLDERTEILKSLECLLSGNTEISIEDCVSSSLHKSQYREHENRCCTNPDLFVCSKILHPPKYLFLYLNRRTLNFSYDTQNNTENTFNRQIYIPTANCKVPYRVQCIIFYVGEDKTGHYSIKYFSDSKWHLNASHSKADIISWEENPNFPVIGFLMEMGTCDYYTRNLDIEDNATKSVRVNLAYSYSSIVEMLSSCLAFREKLINFHLNFHSEVNHDTDEWFMKSLGEIMFLLQKNEISEAQRLVNDMEECYKIPTNIYQSFVLTLSRTNLQVMGNNRLSCGLSRGQIDNYDFFNGEISENYLCENCGYNKMEDKMFNSLVVPIPSSQLSIEECIEKYLEKSESDLISQCCEHPKIVVVRKINSFPQYLFIYFDGDTNTQNCISLADGSILQTESGDIMYSLKSILYAKDDCYFTRYLDKRWKISFNFEAEDIKDINNLSSNKLIGVMMERQDNFNQNNPGDINNSTYDIGLPENDNNSIDPITDQEPVDSSSNTIKDDSNTEINETNCSNLFHETSGNNNLFDSLESKKEINENEDHPNKTSGLTTDTSEDLEILNVGQENKNESPMKISESISKNDNVLNVDVLSTLFNPSYGNYSVAPLLQLLYTCDLFRIAILDYHRKDMIAQSNSSSIISEDVIFVNDFCRLFHFTDLKMDDKVLSVSRHFPICEKGQFFEYYASALKKMRQVIATSLTTDNESNDFRGVTTESNSTSEDFVTDLFFGKIHKVVLCKKCGSSHSKKTKIMSLISPIPFMFIGEHWNIETYIWSYITKYQGKSSVELNNNMYKCCNCPHIIEQRIIQYPKYLFVYMEINKRNIHSIRSHEIGIENDVKYFLCAEIYVPHDLTNSDYGFHLLCNNFYITPYKSGNTNSRYVGFMYQKQ